MRQARRSAHPRGPAAQDCAFLTKLTDLNRPKRDRGRLFVDDPDARSFSAVVDRAKRHFGNTGKLSVGDLDRDRRAEGRACRITLEHIAGFVCSRLGVSGVRQLS